MKALWSGIAALLLNTSVAIAAPAIQADHPTFDFGSVTQGKKVDHVFTIRNGGDSPLQIDKIRTSCGCTAANVSDRTIQPGKTAEIKASFDSTNFVGPITKTITIDSNDPAHRAFNLVIKGAVAELVAIQPRQLTMGPVKPRTAKEGVLKVTNYSGSTLTITGVKSPLAQVVAKANKTKLNNGESTEIAVTVTPKEGDSYVSGYLTIQTDSVRKEIVVPLYVTVK